jgi:hypothetical protein
MTIGQVTKLRHIQLITPSLPVWATMGGKPQDNPDARTMANALGDENAFATAKTSKKSSCQTWLSASGTIEFYGERNRMCHFGVGQLIKERRVLKSWGTKLLNRVDEEL